MNLKKTILLLSSLCAAWSVQAADWPTWGGSADRNMVGEASGIPTEIESGDYLPKSEEINMETTKVKDLENSLKTAKIDLETDKTMLKRHQEVLENEKKQMDLLDKEIGVRAQLADKVAMKKQKQQKLRAAADRLVAHEQ